MIPAIVLAGGLGTRLRSVVPDRPKPMAEVAGKPFLWWLLQRIEQQGITDIYLSVGYRHEAIESHFGQAFRRARLHYVIENEPLGTGGAVAKALAGIDSEAVLVLNGDTLASIDLRALCEHATRHHADLVIGAVEIGDVGRYGAMDFDPIAPNAIRAFREKGTTGAGFINAGTYWLRCAALRTRTDKTSFSFEQDFLSQHLQSLRVHALPVMGDFIDIGIPDDFRLAQTVVPDMVARA